MLTLFDAFLLIGAAAGLIAGTWIGSSFGTIGAVIGVAVGGVCGLVVGRTPWVICFVAVRWSIRRATNAELRARLQREPFLSHLIIAELLIRGEVVENFREYVQSQLASESPLVRQFGESNHRLWFSDPE